MRPSPVLPLLAYALSSLGTLILAGCGRSELQDFVDAGVDAPVARVDAGYGAPAPANSDAASKAEPTRLAEGHFDIDGGTDDGLLIYSTGPALASVWEVWAVPFTGGRPTKIFSVPLDTANVVLYEGGGAGVVHHIVAMSMAGMPVDESYAASESPIYAWDERTGVTTVLQPPHGKTGGTAEVSSDSRYIAVDWETPNAWNPWSISTVNGSNPTFFEPVYELAFDQDWLVYSTIAGAILGTPGAPLLALDGSHAWSTVTLTPNASSFAVDAIGNRALVSNGPFPNGGDWVVLAALDGSSVTMLDDTGGGPPLYLSPDSTFAMYRAHAGTPEAHVAAVTLPNACPAESPYPVTATALPTGTATLFDGEFTGGVAVMDALLNAPSGPVGFFSLNGSSLALVGLSPGATAPDLTLPFSFSCGFTSDGVSALLVRASAASTDPSSIVEGALSAYRLPSGPETAPLSTTSAGWTALDGSTVLFTDQYSSGTFDLRLADVAQAATSSLVVSSVTAYAISRDQKLIAYTPIRGELTDGLWVRALQSLASP